MVWLAISLWFRPTTVLWIGDSHAKFFNQGTTPARFIRAPGGQVVWHLAARLMYSLSQKGFAPKVQRVAGLLRRMPARRRLVLVTSAGEIDVRCHLVPRVQDASLDWTFVDDYVGVCADLADAAGADALVIAVPPPPSVECPLLPEFPIAGTITERLAVFDDLRHQLHAAVDRRSGADLPVALLDATEDLADGAGGLRRDLTDDGCHTNAAGIELVQRRFALLEGVRPLARSRNQQASR